MTLKANLPIAYPIRAVFWIFLSDGVAGEYTRYKLVGFLQDSNVESPDDFVDDDVTLIHGLRSGYTDEIASSVLQTSYVLSTPWKNGHASYGSEHAAGAVELHYTQQILYNMEGWP